MKNLNTAYAHLEKGLQLIKKNIPKDNDVWTHAWRIEKEINKIIKKTAKVLERQYIDNEFNEIIQVTKKTKNNPRFKRDKSLKKKKRK